MTKLRWSDPPREADPARILPDPRTPLLAISPSVSRGTGKIPAGPMAKLLRDYMRAKASHEKACQRTSQIKRTLKALHDAEKRDERMRRKGRKVTPEAKQIARGQQIVAQQARLATAKTIEDAAYAIRLSLNRQWHGHNPSA